MKARPLTDALPLLVGPGVWFAHFVVLYGSETLICLAPSLGAMTSGAMTSGAMTSGAMTWTGAGATLAALAALAVFAGQVWRKGSSSHESDPTGTTFLHSAALWLSLLAMLGVIWAALPIAVLPVCTPPAG